MGRTLIFIHRKGVSTHEVFEEGTVEQLLHQYRYDDFQSMSFVGVYASFQTNKEKQK